MKYKAKGWIWKLTGPFASKNLTTIWGTVYGPPNYRMSESEERHEQIHSEQQYRWGKVGFPFWLWLYLVGFPLGLPFLWNPWRKKWEYEAYTKGSCWGHEKTLKMLRSRAYGWLL